MKEIVFEKTAFLRFNHDDHLGLFDDKIKKIADILERIDPSATSLFDYDEYANKLMVKLFINYNFLILTEKDCLFGVINNQRFLIKSHLKGWFKMATEAVKLVE